MTEQVNRTFESNTNVVVSRIAYEMQNDLRESGALSKNTKYVEEPKAYGTKNDETDDKEDQSEKFVRVSEQECSSSVKLDEEVKISHDDTGCDITRDQVLTNVGYPVAFPALEGPNGKMNYAVVDAFLNQQKSDIQLDWVCQECSMPFSQYLQQLNQLRSMYQGQMTRNDNETGHIYPQYYSSPYTPYPGNYVMDYKNTFPENGVHSDPFQYQTIVDVAGTQQNVNEQTDFEECQTGIEQENNIQTKNLTDRADDTKGSPIQQQLNDQESADNSEDHSHGQESDKSAYVCKESRNLDKDNMSFLSSRSEECNTLKDLNSTDYRTDFNESNDRQKANSSSDVLVSAFNGQEGDDLKREIAKPKVDGEEKHTEDTIDKTQEENKHNVLDNEQINYGNDHVIQNSYSNYQQFSPMDCGYGNSMWNTGTGDDSQYNVNSFETQLMDGSFSQYNNMPVYDARLQPQYQQNCYMPQPTLPHHGVYNGLYGPATPDGYGNMVPQQPAELYGGQPNKSPFQYPAVYFSPAGLITVLLKYDIAVEMTTDQIIRVVSHQNKVVAATNIRGTCSCVYHPSAKIVQEFTTIDVDLFNDRKANLTSEEISFCNKCKCYTFDCHSISASEAKFKELSKDISVSFLFGQMKSHPEFITRCMEKIQTAQYEHLSNGGFVIWINGAKIFQSERGDVSVYCGPKFLKVCPNTNLVRLKTHFVQMSIEMNSTVRITRGSHRLFASTHNGFYIANGKLEAGFDRYDKLWACTLPYRVPIRPGYNNRQRRLGVTKKRENRDNVKKSNLTREMVL